MKWFVNRFFKNFLKNKNTRLSECPRGYAPIKAGVRADVGNFALDSMLLGADADVKAVSLYSDSEKSCLNLHGSILSPNLYLTM